MSKRIPISEAKRIAKQYGYDQVVILANKPDETQLNWNEGWTTTYNTNKSKCGFLGKVAEMLIHNLRSFYSNESMAMKFYKQMKDAAGE